MKQFLVLIATWCALGISSVCAAAPAPLERHGSPKVSYLELQPYTNQKLTDNFGSGFKGNNLASLPKGEQTFEGVKFKITDGLIQLGSVLLKEQKPDKVEAIKVGKRFAKLHLLHATVFGEGGGPKDVADDTPIAEYRIRYEGGGTATIPVVYGKDVRDWTFKDNSKGVTLGKVAWKGDNELTKAHKSRIRLYLTTWENPRPAKRVTSIDYVKVGNTPAGPYCVAVTLEQK